MVKKIGSAFFGSLILDLSLSNKMFGQDFVFGNLWAFFLSFWRKLQHFERCCLLITKCETQEGSNNNNTTFQTIPCRNNVFNMILKFENNLLSGSIKTHNFYFQNSSISNAVSDFHVQYCSSQNWELIYSFFYINLLISEIRKTSFITTYYFHLTVAQVCFPNQKNKYHKNGYYWTNFEFEARLRCYTETCNGRSRGYVFLSKF